MDPGEGRKGMAAQERRVGICVWETKANPQQLTQTVHCDRDYHTMASPLFAIFAAFGKLKWSHGKCMDSSRKHLCAQLPCYPGWSFHMEPLEWLVNECTSSACETRRLWSFKMHLLSFIWILHLIHFSKSQDTTNVLRRRRKYETGLVIPTVPL